MPLIIITGIPASGKTKTAEELREYFESNNKKVNVISENEIVQGMGIDKNILYSDSKKEKELRSVIKSHYIRSINQEEVTIIDGLNYIKGYRYELYCASKSSKTTQCTIHCDVNPNTAWEYNSKKQPTDQYTKEIFDALVLRYEPPDSRNRWDFPLFSVCPERLLSCSDVESSLFSRKPPPPNQSTQCPPLSETNYLYELNRATQEVISSIIAAKKLNMEGEIKVEGCDEKFVLNSEKNTSLAELTRMKRQFLSYVKLHPTLYNNKNLAAMFVQYLNTNL